MTHERGRIDLPKPAMIPSNPSEVARLRLRIDQLEAELVKEGRRLDWLIAEYAALAEMEGCSSYDREDIDLKLSQK